MTKDEALRLVAAEAVEGRNYYSGENFPDEEAIARLVEALGILGFEVAVKDDQIEIEGVDGMLS